MAFTTGAGKVLRLGEDGTFATSDLLLCRACTLPARTQVYDIPVCRYGIGFTQKGLAQYGVSVSPAESVKPDTSQIYLINQQDLTN